jgi:hypothetical protein
MTLIHTRGSFVHGSTVDLYINAHKVCSAALSYPRFEEVRPTLRYDRVRACVRANPLSLRCVFRHSRSARWVRTFKAGKRAQAGRAEAENSPPSIPTNSTAG